MRADGVVDFFPLAQFAVEGFHLQRAGGDLIELLGVGAVGAFHGTVEFGRTRREHEQVQAALLAGLLELGGELTAAIDLQGANGEGHAVLQGIEKLGGGLAGGAGVGLDHVPARNHVASGELLEDHAGQGAHVEGVDLDQIAGAGHRVLLGFTHGIRASAQSAAAAGHAAAGRFDQPGLAFHLGENASHHGSGHALLFPLQQDHELVLAPAGILATQGQDAIGQGWRPGGLAMAMRPVGAALQTRQVVRIVAFLPTIEALAADAKVPAGEGHVLAAAIVVHPIQAGAGLAAQLLPCARQLARTGKLSIMNLHFDTLPSVNNHSEREHAWPNVASSASKALDTHRMTAWRDFRYSWARVEWVRLPWRLPFPYTLR